MTARIRRSGGWALMPALALVVGLHDARDTAADRLERRLYVADRSGLSVYDIDDGHKLLRRIDVPDSGDYKGIAASSALGRLYITSHLRDELICLDLKSERVLWRKKYG